MLGRQRELRPIERRIEVVRAEPDEAKRFYLARALEQRHAGREQLRSDVARLGERALSRDALKVGAFELDPNAVGPTPRRRNRFATASAALRRCLDLRPRRDVTLEGSLRAQPARCARCGNVAKI